MSVFGRGKHRETDPPGWDEPGALDSLFDREPPPTIKQHRVEGEPPWADAENVAADHSATWTPQPSTTVTFTDGITEEQQAAFRAYMDEPARPPRKPAFEPSQVLARARKELAGDPTFGWALRNLPLDAIAALFDPEASDG